jgi:arginine exporter protein ArgO
MPPAITRSSALVLRTTCTWGKVALMAAALSLLADAASEGRKVVLSMLVVGLVFVGVMVLGELTHILGVKRKAAKRDRPL